MALIDRYIVGEHEAVWDEIYEMPATPATVAEVEAVADETMRRVRANLMMIVQRLDAEAFVFHSRPDALRAPAAQVDDTLQQVDDKTTKLVVDGFPGRPLPPSVRAFYRVVGSVNLTGFSRRWPPPVPEKPQYRNRYFLGDGLFVAPVEELLLAADEIPPGTASLAFSPDIFHKENISGGPPYAFDVVSPSLDAFCTVIETAFVPYLRWALKWGGFPGLRLYKNAPCAWINELIKDLEPF